MAKHLGETESAQKYEELYQSGSTFVNEKLFNDEYFFQKIDLDSKSILAHYEVSSTQSLTGDDIYGAYWNEDAQEIKYQIAEGCMIDQVLGQWHADMTGLGIILDKKKVISALHSIYRYNYKKNMRHHVNPCRMYFMADESATLICEWPEGKRKPLIAAPYAEESFHGMEYQVASHMIHHSMLKEGLDIVKAVRNRYDGERRNPWNEIECGSNYARSMASYALLIAYSGFEFDLSSHYIGFYPVQKLDNHQYFWSVGKSWGIYIQSEQQASITICQGQLMLSHFGLYKRPTFVSLVNNAVVFDWLDNRVHFRTKLSLRDGDSLIFSFY